LLHACAGYPLKPNEELAQSAKYLKPFLFLVLEASARVAIMSWSYAALKSINSRKKVVYATGQVAPACIEINHDIFQ